MGNLNKVTYTDHQTVITADNLNAIQDSVIQNTSYITCTTGASTAAKTATLANFVLTTGSAVKVKFTNSNTAANPTLNVNSTGAKPIMQYGTTAAGTTATESWDEGAVVEFVYDGTSWVMQGRNTIDAVSKANGGTFDGDVVIDDKGATTSSEVSILTLGNSTATGTVGNSNGMIRMYGQGDKYVNLRPVTTSGSYTTDNRTITLPDESGTLMTNQGGTFSGDVTIDRASGTAGASGWSAVKIGNNKDLSVAGNSAGYLRIFGTSAYYGDISFATGMPTAERQYRLPNASGTIALDLSESFTGTAMTDGTLNRCTGTIGERPSIYTNGREYYIYGRLTITSFVRTNSNPYITFQTSFRPSHTLYGDTGIRFDNDVAKPEKSSVTLSPAGVLSIQNTETHFNMPTNSVRVIWLFPMLALV